MKNMIKMLAGMALAIMVLQVQAAEKKKSLIALAGDYFRKPSQSAFTKVIERAKESDTDYIEGLLQYLNKLSSARYFWNTGQEKAIDAMRKLLAGEIELKMEEDIIFENVTKPVGLLSDLVDDYMKTPDDDRLAIVVDAAIASDIKDVKDLLRYLKRIRSARFSGDPDQDKVLDGICNLLAGEIALRGMTELGKKVIETDVDRPLSEAVLKYIKSYPKNEAFLWGSIKAIVGGSEKEDIKFALEDVRKLNPVNKNMEKAKEKVITYLEKL